MEFFLVFSACQGSTKRKKEVAFYKSDLTSKSLEPSTQILMEKIKAVVVEKDEPQCRDMCFHFSHFCPTSTGNLIKSKYFTFLETKSPPQTKSSRLAP